MVVSTSRIEEGLALHHHQMRRMRANRWPRAKVLIGPGNLEGQQFFLAITPQGSQQAQSPEVSRGVEADGQFLCEAQPQQQQPGQRQPARAGQEVDDRQPGQQRSLDRQATGDRGSEGQQRQQCPAGAQERQIQAGMPQGVAEILEILEHERFAKGMELGVAHQNQEQHPRQQRSSGKERALQDQQQTGKQQQPESEVDGQGRNRSPPQRPRRRLQKALDQ
jgi:hypothetical protein